jgi:hypothetical protein
LTAGFTAPANPFWLISGGHVLQQSMYVVESGLILFIVLFASYFRLSWSRQTFGIALGLGILSCEHLASWAVLASEVLGSKSILLDIANMATYHVCVLIWMYYLLVPQKKSHPSNVPPSDPPAGLAAFEHLDVWNQELERLLHQ